MDDFEVPDTGAVFTFGKTRFADNKPSHFFIKNDPVVDVACGDEHTIILCQNGRLFAFGSNEYGQLGLGHTEIVTRPSCIKSLKPSKVRLLACGRSHSIAVTDNNQIYTFGNNSDGQLGHGNITDCDIPTKIENQPMKSFDKVIQVAAGSSHSAILTDKGRMFVWGSNTENQLGLNLESNVERVTVPTQIRIHEKIKFISCGYYHTGFITESGKVYMFGENENGKLGLSINGTVAEPTKLNLNIRFSKLFCGGHHSFFISSDNEVYACGLNINGQLGIGDENVPFVKQPIKVNAEFFDNPIQFISCGERHTAFVTKDGKLYTCGDTKHGKLCQENNEDVESQYTPQLISKFNTVLVTNVSCGGCHTVVTVQKRPKGTKQENLPTIKQPTLPSPAIPSKVLLPKIEDLKNNHMTKPQVIDVTKLNGEIEMTVNGNIHEDEDSRDDSQREFELLEKKFKEEEEEIESTVPEFIKNEKNVEKLQKVKSLDANSVDSLEIPNQNNLDKNSTASLSIKDVPASSASDNSDNTSTSSSSDAPDSEASQSQQTSTTDPDNKDLELPKDVKNKPNTFQNKVSKLLSTIKSKRIFTDTNCGSKNQVKIFGTMHGNSQISILGVKNSANKVAPNAVQNTEKAVSKEKSRTCSIL